MIFLSAPKTPPPQKRRILFLLSSLILRLNIDRNLLGWSFRALGRGLNFSIEPVSAHQQGSANRNTGIEMFDRDWNFQSRLRIAEIPSESGVAQICCKLRTKFVQNCRYFVSHIRGRMRKIVANLSVNFGQFDANTPFQCPLFEILDISIEMFSRDREFQARIDIFNRDWWETDFYPVRVLGGNCARPMRLPDPSPVLDKNRAPMGPEILFSTGAGVWRKAPMAFPDSSSWRWRFYTELVLKPWFSWQTPQEKSPKLFVSQQTNQSQLWIPRKPRKIGVWVSGAEIQTSAVDTRTAVWVSTPEKFSKIVLGKTRIFSRKFRGGL